MDMKIIAPRESSGFTLVEIMIVVAILGLLSAIAVPNIVRARDTARTNSCIANIRELDSAKHQWALEEKKDFTEVPLPADLIGVTLYLKTQPICPLDNSAVPTITSSYDLWSIDVIPTCKIQGSAPINPHVLE